MVLNGFNPKGHPRDQDFLKLKRGSSLFAVPARPPLQRRDFFTIAEKLLDPLGKLEFWGKICKNMETYR